MGALTRKVQRIPLGIMHRLTLDPGALGILHLLILARGLRALTAGVQLRVRVPVPFRIDRPYTLACFVRRRRALLSAAGVQLRVCVPVPCRINGRYYGRVLIMGYV